MKICLVKHGQEKKSGWFLILDFQKLPFKIYIHMCVCVYHAPENRHDAAGPWGQKMLWGPQKHNQAHATLDQGPATSLWDKSQKNALCFPLILLLVGKGDKVGNGHPTKTTPVVSDKYSVFFAQICYCIPSEANCFLARHPEEIDDDRLSVQQAWFGI